MGKISPFYLDNGHQQIPLWIGDNRIGRRITHSSFTSDKHCNISVGLSTVILNDYSRNGTFINNQRIKELIIVVPVHSTIGFGSTITQPFILKQYKTDIINLDI